jgi:FemAB-related protein (PEP-CTERM system-associated)
LKVEYCKDASRWDKYVAAAQHASNYHRWVWGQVVQETYGHRPYYLAATEGSEIRGVLPLVSIRSRIFGKSLVSVPFFSYGGVLADTAEASRALTGAAEELGKELGVRHVELRQGDPLETAWTDLAPKVTMEVELPATVEELSARLSPKMRKRIRFAAKHGLEPEWSGGEAVSDFYPIFAMNMRNLGTPVYPRSWFDNICKAAPGEIRILTLRDQGRPVASAFVSIYRDTVELPWAASLPESREKFSPLLMYWSLLEWSLENGYRRVDLGRCTPGSGNHDFKRRWVCNEKPLHWYYWLAPGTPVPQLRPENSRYRLAVRIWQHLPVAVATALGPRVVRAIP